MKADRYLFDGSHPCALRKLPCDSKDDHVKKEDILVKTAENLEKMAALQDAFYADGREGLVIILQALDAAGKDSTVKHVMGGLNPQGVQVTSFKQPTSEELHHDFLWRVNKALPPRGSIAIFNRSYYEDVLVVQIHDLQKTYQMAPRVLEDSKKDFFEKRYRQIRSYEEYLYENSYRVVKIFLHVSKDEQKKRFLERIDRPEKNWKFSCSDLKERMRFDDIWIPLMKSSPQPLPSTARGMPSRLTRNGTPATWSARLYWMLCRRAATNTRCFRTMQRPNC